MLVFVVLAVLLAAPAQSAAAPGAELVPSPPKRLSGNARPGATLVLGTRVVNRGARRAPASVGELVLSTDARREDDDAVLQRIAVPALAPRRPRRASVRVRLPADLTAGRYRIILCLDAGEVVAETDEANNCSPSRPLPQPPPQVTVVPEPDPTAPATVRECGDLPARTAPAEAFTAMWQRPGAGWTGGDGELSIPLPDGRLAWLFADTFIGGIVGDRRGPDTRLIQNTIVVQDDACLTTVFGGTREVPRPLVEPRDADAWYWPASGYVQGGELRILYYRMRRTDAPVFNFRFDGTDVARFSLPDLRLIRVEPLVSEGNPMWGGAVVDAGSYTYMFGVKGDGLRSLLHVARTPRGRLGDAPLEYWDGRGWNPDPGASQPVTDDVTTSLSFLVDRDGWTLVTQDPLLGEDVTVRQAPAPEGPWTPKRVIARAPRPAGGFTYGAAIHPELSEGRSSMLLSYSVNGWQWEDILAQPDLYRPRFMRVDLDGSSPARSATSAMTLESCPPCQASGDLPSSSVTSSAPGMRREYSSPTANG